MPEIVEIEVYKYEELSTYAQERAFEKWQESAGEFADYEHIIASAKGDLYEYGIHTTDITWSGFYCQGDGASLHGMLSLQEFVDNYVLATPPLIQLSEAELSKYTVAAELVRDGWVNNPAFGPRGFRSYNTKVDDIWSTEGYNISDDAVLEEGVLAGANVKQLMESIDYDAVIGSLQEVAETALNDFAHKVWCQLRDEYDGATSEECFLEEAEFNSFRFYEDGRRYLG